MWERQLRAVLCWAVFFVMIAFYLPVVAAIQALLQVSLCFLSPSAKGPILCRPPPLFPSGDRTLDGDWPCHLGWHRGLSHLHICAMLHSWTR